MGLVIVSPPAGLRGVKLAVAGVEITGVDDVGVGASRGGAGGAGAKGIERSSGYVWKNRGAKVVPKNAPGDVSVSTAD